MGFKDYAQKVEAFVHELDVGEKDLEDVNGDDDDVKQNEEAEVEIASKVKKNRKKSKRAKIKEKEGGLSEKELADEQERLIQAAAARMMASIGHM